MSYIDNEAAYDAKIHACMTTRCVPERCPKCGQRVGMAVKANGTRYLAELAGDERHGYVALKTRPHFVTCTGVREPGVIVKGVTVKVVKGRKVPTGTTGVVIWMGRGEYGERVGIRDAAGTVHWTALTNVVEVSVD